MVTPLQPRHGAGGRKMTLEWNRGEDPAAVAVRFCEANGLPLTHTVDIVTMIGQVPCR